MDDAGFNLFVEKRISSKNPQAWKKFNIIKRGSALRGIVFSITFDEYLNFYTKPCYYCGCIAIGLDRIDSALPYIKENVVACCSTCNMMKQTLDVNDFIAHCRRIVENHAHIEDNNYSGMTGLANNLDTQQKYIIANSLNKHNGNRTRVAKELGISTTTLWRKMKQYNIYTMPVVNNLIDMKGTKASEADILLSLNHTGGSELP